MLGTAAGLLIVLIALSVPVAAVLGIIALVIALVYSSMPIHLALGEVAWQNGIDILLIAIPLFILMGEIMLRSGIAKNMYEALSHWLNWLPGGLMHSNIGACTLFAATSGSSIATAATIGTVAIPEMDKGGYNRQIFLGTLAAGGTLGILIPPSINMIVYGLLTDTSVPKLYLAGFVPGFLLAGLFMLTVLLAVLVKPKWGGHRIESSWRERFRSLPALIPPFGIFLIVVGTIYAGIATPTEAASFGVVASVGLAAWNGTLSVQMLKTAMQGAMRTTAMVMLIVIAAIFLNLSLAMVGLTKLFHDFILNLGLSPSQTLWIIIISFLVLGCFMENFSLMLIFTPLVAPIIAGLGYDLVWFGILMMLMLETALITPPIGVNLFVIQGVREKGSLNDVILGALPFVVTLMVMIVLLVLFPQLALWLPAQFG
jgi:tripartite ATP-independent transporter DctM subunit